MGGGQGSSVYVLYSSNLNDAGKPACPDCARSLPAVTAVVVGAQRGSLLEVWIELPSWKDKQNP